MKYHHNNQLVVFITQDGEIHSSNIFASSISKFLKKLLKLALFPWDNSQPFYIECPLENQPLEHKSGMIGGASLVN